MGSGTNAPLYTTPFSIARHKMREDMENHESRLAEALELDRSTRVLEFRDPSISPPRSVANDKKKNSEIEQKTIWNGTEWVMGHSDQSAHAGPLLAPEIAQPDILQRPPLRKNVGLFQWHPSSRSTNATDPTF